LVIHCQVITSQVTAYRPDRDCPVIGRPVPRAAVAGCQWRRKVILTTLLVKERYFGRVTAGRTGSPPGQVMSLPCRGGKPRGGAAAGPARGPASGWMSSAGMQQGDHSGRPACGRRRGTAIGTPVPSRQISWPSRTFYELAGRPGPDTMAGHSMPSVNRWLTRLRVFCRIAARGWPAGWPGRGPGRSGRHGRVSWPRRARRPRRPASRPQRLFSCPARPPAAGGTTNGYLSRPQRCSASIRLIT